MGNVRLDHFITAVTVENVDDYMEEYGRAGFNVVEQSARHEPGLRNRFVSFGPEYLEFTWVEDEAAFSTGQHKSFFPDLSELRAGTRPWGIGLATEDVRALRESWSSRGYTLPEVIDGLPADAAPGTEPVWSFQPIPSDTVGGVVLFALTYHSRRNDDVRKVQVTPNTTYAIEGVTFVSDSPRERAQRWRDLLAPGEEVREEENFAEVRTGPHFARWLTPLHYQEYLGLSYKEPPHSYAEMAVIHLLAEDLEKAEELIATSGRDVSRLPDAASGLDTLYIYPDPRDGFTFAITQRPTEEWLAERTALTGEKLELTRNA
ncbi:MAG: VOC family protein [Chloroflexota bacterium]|nr:VOC family protein [Chloroflexota bacterium]